MEEVEKQSGSVLPLSDIPVEGRNTRSADGQQTATRQHESPAAAMSFVTLPVRRWPPPPPPDKGMLSACEVLTWIGWGEARPNERAYEYETKLLDVWGVSSNRFGDLARAFETGQSQGGLVVTPEQVRDYIQKREGREYAFAELAERLRKDIVALARACELLELASNEIVKAYVDGKLIALGRQAAWRQSDVLPHDEVPLKDFVHDGIVITRRDTIDAGGRQLWESVRFNHSEIMALWPANAPSNGSDDMNAERTQPPRKRGRPRHPIREQQKLDDGDCPVTIAQFTTSTGDPMPMLRQWAAWKYRDIELPGRKPLLDVFRGQFGTVRFVNEKTMAALRAIIATEAQKKGGAPTHRIPARLHGKDSQVPKYIPSRASK